MKKQFLLTAIAVGLSLCGYAQTKGTSTLGLGANVSTYKSSTIGNNANESKNEMKGRNFNLGYGYFIKDNTRLGLDFSYGVNNQTQSNGDYSNENKNYGASVSYQQYFPIVKSLYAYAGGNGGYIYSKTAYNSSNPSGDRREGNTYNVGAYGGVTWFLSKRFAFETNLLSANVVYQESKHRGYNTGYQAKEETTNFSLNTKGFIDDLGFKIYLLF